jgi:sulfonate dioxygenase
MREAYRRLSKPMQAFLEGLEGAVHSGVAQANHSRSGARGGIVRRAPVEHVHPLVRTHPVTGDKSLYVNEQFVTRIVGLRQEESAAVLKLLNDHVARGADFHARLKWETDMVIVRSSPVLVHLLPELTAVIVVRLQLWDNRVMNHTAIVDFKDSGATRFGCRVTPQAERPTAGPSASV